MSERDAFKTDNIGLEMQNKELTAKLASLQTEIETVKQNIAAAQNERDKAVDDYNRISAKYSELQNAQEDLVQRQCKRDPETIC